MTGNALQTVDRSTGEVVTVESFDFGTYLDGIGKHGLERQQKLAAAYDAACAALIGPNDVQKEGARTFKKKSAWRKLGRHFSLSTSVSSLTKEWIGDGNTTTPVFLATVTVKASAPWGQSAESVGACGTDEESGRRKITIADAIATAETRATNRAISSLIAMGEVSAEEMSKGRNSEPPRERLMPFGDHKGKPLSAVDTETLSKAVTWARSKDAEKFASFIAACENVMEERRNDDEDLDKEFEGET